MRKLRCLHYIAQPAVVFSTLTKCLVFFFPDNDGYITKILHKNEQNSIIVMFHDNADSNKKTNREDFTITAQ